LGKGGGDGFGDKVEPIDVAIPLPWWRSRSLARQPGMTLFDPKMIQVDDRARIIHNQRQRRPQ
jgi:hypothetical protein